MNPTMIRFGSLLRRELARFWKIKRQTIAAPMLETFLYISVFGAALGTDGEVGARLQDGHDDLAFDQHIGQLGAGGRNHGSTLDVGRHVVPLWLMCTRICPTTSS